MDTHRSWRAVALFTLVALTACAAGSETESTTTLRYWTLVDPGMEGDPRSEALRLSIEEFEEETPGVTVDVETFPWPQLSSMLLQASAADEAPDVVRVLAWDLPKHVAAGDLYPLDDFTTAEYRQDWLLGWETLVFDGQKMAVPMEYRSPMLYYRNDHLGQSPPPTQWDEMVTAGQRHSLGDLYGVSTGFGRAAMATAVTEPLVAYLWDAGLEVFNDDGTIGFDNDRGYDVFEALAGLVEDGVTPRTNVSYQYEDVYQSLKAGSSVFALHGSHRANAVRADSGLAPSTLRTMPLPNMFGPEESAPAHVMGWTFAIPTDADDADLSWKFIEYMTRPSTQSRQMQMTGELPTRQSPYSDPWFTSPEGREAATWARWFEESGRTLEYGEHWAQFGEMASDALTLMILKGESAEDAVGTFAEQYNELAR